MKAIITLKNDRKIIYDLTCIKYCQAMNNDHIYIVYKTNNIETGIKIFFEDIKNIELKEFKE